MATIEGPPLAAMLHRLLETPQEFLNSDTHALAVVHDTITLLTGQPVDAEMMNDFERNAHAGPDGLRQIHCALLVSWLLTDPWFASRLPPEATLWHVLVAVPSTLGDDPHAQDWNSEPERREELVRTLLSELRYRPQGESEAQAQDRLAAVSAVQRRRILAAAAQAEQRDRELRDALAAQAARESADKLTRE
jgi:hypothetical protein